MRQAETLLSDAGIRPTSNRLLVADALLRARRPLSLGELEEKIATLERSSVLRVLSLMLERHFVHTIEDGRGITKYELCHHSPAAGDADDDMHVHFYCEHCRRTFCFEDIAVPSVGLPAGFVPRSVNYMLKGLCPDCREV